MGIRRVFTLCATLWLMAWGSSLAQSLPSDRDPRILTLLSSISAEQLEGRLRRLVGFGTRHTLFELASTSQGIVAARQWVYEDLKAVSPRLHVSFDTHQIKKADATVALSPNRLTRDFELRNVMAILPGRTARRIYVTAHYDSVNIGPTGSLGSVTASGPAAQEDLPVDVAAPGANDNGSGTVLVLELARAFANSGITFDATLVFLVTAGEEQGLVGARAHAQQARATSIPIQAIFNNDIVGGEVGGSGIMDGASVRLYAEGPEDSPSRALARFTARTASRYVPSHRVRPMARRDRFSRGGDHSAFNLEGFAAVGFRESRENFAKQHSDQDTLDGVSIRYLTQNARVNAAAIAVLALAPPPPVVTDERGRPLLDRRPSGYDARLRWQASPGAAGYRVFWRDVWSPDWQHEVWVGNVTEFVLPATNIDDLVFGVAAADGEGHESSIASYVPPPL